MRDHRSGRARRWRRVIGRSTTRFHHVPDVHPVDHHAGDDVRSWTYLPRSFR